MFNKLIHKNITFFVRYYKLVATAVLITVAVIVGSLAVGDSVRTTLTKRVTERLGETESIIFSRNSFMADEWVNDPVFGETARGILLTNGFISRNGKLIPVFVWGVNDMSIPKGSAKINQALSDELEEHTPDAIVLRLPASGLIPSGSLFVTENYTTSMRLTFDGIVDVETGGNISMKNEQIIPFNIFINREELAEAMHTEGKINLILSKNNVSADDLEQAWKYSFSGLSVSHPKDFTEIRSDRIFLQDEVVTTISRNHPSSNRLFSYLANSIESDDMSIPYSFVTALDHYQKDSLRKDEIILSDYSAKRLRAEPGDRIRLTYFTSHNLKTLQTDTVFLRVKKIIPLRELQEDKTLSADFPGLSDVERCTEWDSDLPINMDLITDEDEKYWELYRSTPKAIIAYDAIAGDWGNAYGNATAIRVENANPDLSGLRTNMFGIQLIHPREAGLFAAKNGVDFSGLFLALGFFIVVSAVLLMQLPLSEMLYRRKNETDLLKALGFTRKRIIKMRWMESAPIVLTSSIAGILAGLCYTTLTMWLLGNLWKGATHTGGFSVYPSITAISGGFFAGIGLSLWVLRRVIVRSLKEESTTLKASQPSGKAFHSPLIRVITASILTIVVTGANLFFLHSVTLFVIAGIVLIGTAAIWGDYLISRKGSLHSGSFHMGKLVWGTLYAHKKQVILSFLALATGVFIVFSVGLNRKGFADSSQLLTGTGGYTLWCESSVPIYHNMMTEEGREKLSLTTLPADANVLQCLRYTADDASCLNLNKVSTPSVLGVDMEVLSNRHFRIEQCIGSLNREEVFREMRIKTDSVYPALIDATVLTWGLMMNLGDTLHYTNDQGRPVAIRLIGTLANSIFQGHILIDRTFFSEIWEETAGSEVFLLETNEANTQKVRTLLSQALNEYGVGVTTTNDRLKQFNAVTDTYLTIFLTLGGIGLLIGIMSFIIVVRKNLAMRRREIGLYRMLGFNDQRIEQILYRENLFVPLYAVATGIISALVGVSINFTNTGVRIWLLALFFMLLFVICLLVFIKKSVKNEIQNCKHTLRDFYY